MATALIVAVSLAQVGEFSFILAALGVELGILPERGQHLILGGAIISILLNPLMFWAAQKLLPRLERKAVATTSAATAGAAPVVEPPPAPDALAEPEMQTAKTGHTVLVGYGRVGSVAAEELIAAGTAILVIEDNEDRVRAARLIDLEVIEGNAATARALFLANIKAAQSLVVAIPNAFEAGQAIEQARRENAALIIVARAHSDEEAAYLAGLGANHVIMGEREIGLGMVDYLRKGGAVAGR